MKNDRKLTLDGIKASKASTRPVGQDITRYIDFSASERSASVSFKWGYVALANVVLAIMFVLISGIGASRVEHPKNEGVKNLFTTR
jgi:hypothetical protein